MQLSTRQFNELRENWAKFLSRFTWDWYCTLTFRDPPSPERAHRMFRQFVCDIERAAGCLVGWFAVDEYGMINGRFHIHALVSNVAHLRRLYWMDEWDRRAGYARILPYDPQRGAGYYLGKYMCKQFGYWDMSDPKALLAYQPVLPGALGGKGVVCGASPNGDNQGARVLVRAG
jgi:hypothetical protein